MGVLGVSLIVASFVYVIAFPVDWLPTWLQRFRKGLGGAITEGPSRSSDDQPKTLDDNRPPVNGTERASATATAREKPNGSSVANRKARDAAAMPPPPPPIIQPPILESKPDDEEQTTPKAEAAQPAQAVPSFSLSEDKPQAPSKPAVPSLAPTPAAPAPSSASSLMPPPPRPSPVPNRAPQPFLGPNSAQRARGPVPNRNPLAPPSTGLAPPPTHSSKPAKPNRKVLLAPGRSPLDWARISGPAADLRGVDPSTPYMRVTPSMLKRQTGRKGKDAWMGLNGKVYNITPYAEFHPGGVPELMRGAGRDGTKVFGEIHPWVNYETMLSSCLIGLLVDEPEGNQESEMDQMD